MPKLFLRSGTGAYGKQWVSAKIKQIKIQFLLYCPLQNASVLTPDYLSMSLGVEVSVLVFIANN